MKTEYSMVREFMRAFGQRVPEGMTMPEYPDVVMREKLISEENQELYHAKTQVEKFDAVLDLLYVVLGAAAECGFTPEQLTEGFAEVHRSNMSKVWTRDECERFQMLHAAIISPSKDRPWIVRRPDGKIVKSPSYSPPRLEGILK